MAPKSRLVIFIFIAIMATSIAEANILNVTLTVSGIVNCTINSNVGGTAPPPFPNATVLLQCPPGINISTATTNSLGQFNITVNVPGIRLPFVSTCRIVVLTPLVNCNASLPPVGRLVSNILNIVRIRINGTNIIVTLGFPSLNFIPRILG